MSTRTTLSQLSNDHLRQSSAWRAIGDYANDEDATLEAVALTDRGFIPGDVGEVWCLCRAKFANGSKQLACAMCRGDAAFGPLLQSVWNGERHIPIILPPAPPEVLEVNGPEVFASSFGLSVKEVFPIQFEVIPGFAVKPERRTILLDTIGIK